MQDTWRRLVGQSSVVTIEFRGHASKNKRPSPELYQSHGTIQGAGRSLSGAPSAGYFGCVLSHPDCSLCCSLLTLSQLEQARRGSEGSVQRNPLVELQALVLRGPGLIDASAIRQNQKHRNRSEFPAQPSTPQGPKSIPGTPGLAWQQPSPPVQISGLGPRSCFRCKLESGWTWSWG